MVDIVAPCGSFLTEMGNLPDEEEARATKSTQKSTAKIVPRGVSHDFPLLSKDSGERMSAKQLRTWLKDHGAEISVLSSSSSQFFVLVDFCAVKLLSLLSQICFFKTRVCIEQIPLCNESFM